MSQLNTGVFTWHFARGNLVAKLRCNGVPVALIYRPQSVSDSYYVNVFDSPRNSKHPDLKSAKIATERMFHIVLTTPVEAPAPKLAPKSAPKSKRGLK